MKNNSQSRKELRVRVAEFRRAASNVSHSIHSYRRISYDTISRVVASLIYEKEVGQDYIDPKIMLNDFSSLDVARKIIDFNWRVYRETQDEFYNKGGYNG